MGVKLTYRETKRIKPKNKDAKYKITKVKGLKLYRNDKGELIYKKYSYRKVDNKDVDNNEKNK